MTLGVCKRVQASHLKGQGSSIEGFGVKDVQLGDGDNTQTALVT